MHRDGPIVCLVTDRTRWADDRDGVEQVRRRLVELAGEAVAAGIDLLQVRERGLETADLAALVNDILAVTRGTPTRVVVNDRLDVALACGADGVHLRADSIAPRAARSMVPTGFLVGRSVHQVDEAREQAAWVDYLLAGTMFPTSSKPSSVAWLGEGGLAAIVRAVRVPVLAIGGITVDRVAQVAEAGAAGVAAIGLFVPGEGRMGETVDAVRRQFDSVRAGS